MHPDLERLVAEDEIGRAAVDVAAERNRVRVDEARCAIAEARAARLGALQRQLAAEIAAIDADADRTAKERRARRILYERERFAAAASEIDSAADAMIAIVRDGKIERGAR